MRCLVSLRRAVAVALGAALLGAAVPAAANAATTCLYDDPSDTLTVTMVSLGDSALLGLGPGGEIQIRGGGPVLACGGATTANTEFINVFDNTGTNAHVTIGDPQGFAPLGINLVFAGGDQDSLSVFGEDAPATITLGTSGINTDNDASRDINFVGSVPESIQVYGGAAADTIRARGGANTGSVLSGTFLELGGVGGNDTLEGSDGGDLLTGDADSDTMRGFGGEDVLIGDELSSLGDDLYEGGPGFDYVSWPLVLKGVTVDFAKAGPQQTGNGEDSFAEVEGALGTNFDDTILGTAGADVIKASSGDDTVMGRGGEDLLSGGAGIDTLTYADAPAGVVVDLEAGTANGGDGKDLLDLAGFENLIGSQFADSLSGSAAANQITGLGGADVVQALGGADRVDVRDGAADNASCGSEVDSATADRRSLDTVQADCEQVDALPEAAGPGGGGTGAGGGGASSANGDPGGKGATGGNGNSGGKVVFSLRAAKRQPLLAQGGVLVTLRCSQEACTVALRAAGRRLQPVTVTLAAGAPKTVKLRIRKAKRAAIRDLILGGAELKLRISATATDADGNAAPGQLIVKAKRPRGPLS